MSYLKSALAMPRAFAALRLCVKPGIDLASFPAHTRFNSSV